MRRATITAVLVLWLIASLAFVAHAQTSGQGRFLSACRLSHSLPDDPIVSPGNAGASHLHDFFANISTDADSTYASLRASGTTCRRTQDRAAYWVPALYLNGQKVDPGRVNAYYVTRHKPPQSIRPFPAGLKIFAGDSHATGPQPMRIASWGCYPDGPANTGKVPTCPEGSTLRMHIRFPDCWNGADRDSTGHKSHMAYSVRGRCPSGYPVPVPGLNLNVVYAIQGGPGATLASGSAYTIHADFFNAWNQRELARLVRACLNADVHCSATGP